MSTNVVFAQPRSATRRWAASRIWVRRMARTLTRDIGPTFDSKRLRFFTLFLEHILQYLAGQYLNGDIGVVFPTVEISVLPLSGAPIPRRRLRTRPLGLPKPGVSRPRTPGSRAPVPPGPHAVPLHGRGGNADGPR